MPSSPAAPAEDFAAAFGDAIALHKAGSVADAIARYEQLRQASPDNPHLLYLLGGAHFQLGHARDATALLERSLTLRPGFTPALDLAGSAWVAAGEPARALPYLRQSADQSSATAEVIDRLATALLQCDLPEEALAQYDRRLALDPDDADALTGRGTALTHLNRLADAEAALRRCVESHPRYAKAFVALGIVLGQQGRFAEAEAQFRIAVDIASGKAGSWHWLAISLQKQARSAEAVEAYTRARTLDPSKDTIAIELAEALIDLHRLDEAGAVLSAVATADSDSSALTARGRLEERRGDLDAAIDLHDRAIAANPRNEAAYINRGSARRFGGDYEGAISDYDAAIAIKPNAAPAIANRGLALLTLGRLREAWPFYRSRIKAQGNAVDLTGGKPWDGGSLAGKRVLVWTEYGLGDEILFASLLDDVLKEARSCTLVCSDRMVAVFSRSFPRVRVVALGGSIDDTHDVHVALTDLAQRFRPELRSFPVHDGYLQADRLHAAALRARYGTQRKLVGISWRSASGATGAFKSAPLESWDHILSVPDVTFVSLQYGDADADLRALRARTGVDVVLDSAVDSSGDLDPFAAQVAAMDLVISVSNTTVHVAGALGKPVWILVPEGRGAHWYWFRERTDSPWYPSARLFRQEQPGQWATPLRAVADALRTWARQ